MATMRTMAPSDYRAVAAMANDAAMRAQVGRPTWETAADVAVELSALDQAEFVVAEDEAGTILGLAGYALGPDGEAALYGPLVSAEGHGVGAWLEGRVEVMARQRGAQACSMLIGLGNRAGAAWAEWRGYQRDLEHPELLLMWLYPGELKPSGPAESSLAAVRPAIPSDLDAVVSLYQTCYPAGRMAPDEWGALLSQCRVLEAGGVVRAFLRLEPGTGSLREVCVAPGARRQGLATALVAGALQQFWRERPARVGLAVRLDNTAAVALCRRLGFRREIAVAKWLKREG